MTTNAGQGVGKEQPYSLLVGMQMGVAIMEIKVKVSQKTKNRTTL